MGRALYAAVVFTIAPSTVITCLTTMSETVNELLLKLVQTFLSERGILSKFLDFRALRRREILRMQNTCQTQEHYR